MASDTENEDDNKEKQTKEDDNQKKPQKPEEKIQDMVMNAAQRSPSEQESVPRTMQGTPENPNPFNKAAAEQQSSEEQKQQQQNVQKQENGPSTTPGLVQE